MKKLYTVKMKSSKNKIWKMMSIMLLSASLIFFSCNKENHAITSGKSTVRISLQGINFEGEKSPFDKNSSVNVRSNDTFTENPQEIALPFDDEFKIIARLLPENSLTIQPTENNTALNKSASTTPTTSKEIIALPAGTLYYVAVYQKDGTFIDKKEYAVGMPTTDDSKKFLGLDADETYTFIAYTDAHNNNFAFLDHTSVGPGKSLEDATIKLTSGAVNFMFYRKDVKLTYGDNLLNIVLKNQFSQLSTEINVPSEIGSIASASAIVKKHHNDAVFTIKNSTIVFNNENLDGAKVIFPSLSGTSIKSNPTIIWGNMANGTIDLSLSITGKGAKQFSLDKLKITPGVRYKLVLNIKPVDDGYEIGDSFWAPGNLIYNATTNSYGFATTNDAYGDYFFPKYLKPKRLDGTNRNPTDPTPNINGGFGDPCALVLPLNTWRLPRVQEFEDLMNSTNVGGKDNNNIPSEWQPARYSGKYKGAASTTNKGLFFGTQESPGVKFEDYFFLPYGGFYPDNNTGNSFGDRGYYMLNAGVDKFNLLEIGGPWDTRTSVAVNKNYAVQIRCVKVKDSD